MSQINDEVLSGWLEKKQSGLMTKWKRCWYVVDLTDISNAYLAHYEHSTMIKENVAADRLALGDRQIIPLSSIKSLEQNGQTISIKLTSDGEVTLRAPNEDVTRRWYKVLRRGKKMLKKREKELAAKTRQKSGDTRQQSTTKGRQQNTQALITPPQISGTQVGASKDFSGSDMYRSKKVDFTLKREKNKKGKGKGKGKKEKKEKAKPDYDFFNLPPPPPSSVKEKEKRPPPRRTGGLAEVEMKDGRPAFDSSKLVKNDAFKPSRVSGFGSMKQAKQKVGSIAPRNAVLPIMTQSEEEKGLTKGKTPEVMDMLKDTLAHSTSLAHLLFADLNENAVTKMVSEMYRVDVHARENVVIQGQQGNLFYVIERGDFHVYITSTYNDAALDMQKGVPLFIANKGPKTFFGELALLYEQPSNVTVRAATDGVLWAVSRKAFHEITKVSSQEQQQEKMMYLQSIDMIREMISGDDIVALADAMDYVTFGLNDVILEKGEPVRSVLWVVKGHVGLFKDDEDEPEMELDPETDQNFGSLSLWEPFNTAHTLKALQPNTKLLKLDTKEVEGIVGSMRENLKKKFEEDPAFKNEIMDGVAKFSKDLDQMTAEAAVKLTIQHIKTTVRNTTGSLMLGRADLGVGTEFIGGTIMPRDTQGPLPAIDKDWTEAPPIIPVVNFSDLKPIKMLGSGNFGHVHLMLNRATGLQVTSKDGEVEAAPKYFAMKILCRDFIVQNGWETMAENEMCAMVELSYHAASPFIIKLYHSFTDTKNIYFLLELCDGGDLYALVKRQKQHRLNETNTRFYVAGVVRGLEAMHERTIIYRDLKPENIMVDSTGYIKIGDFGLAKKTLRTFTVCGTPDYMAPETILSKGHDKAVDWWAVGVLLYEVGTGVTPFNGSEPMDIYEAILAHKVLSTPKKVKVSTECYDLMDLLLQKKRTKRLGNLREGASGVTEHPYFNGFDWAKYMKKQLPAPQILKKKKPYVDTDNYDPEFENEEPDDSDWVPAVNTTLEKTPIFPFG